MGERVETTNIEMQAEEMDRLISAQMKREKVHLKLEGLIYAIFSGIILGGGIMTPASEIRPIIMLSGATIGLVGLINQYASEYVIKFTNATKKLVRDEEF